METLEFFDSRRDAEDVETRLIRSTKKEPLSLNIQDRSWPALAYKNSFEVSCKPVHVVQLKTWTTWSFVSVSEACRCLKLSIAATRVLLGDREQTQGYILRYQSTHSIESAVRDAKAVKGERQRKVNEPVRLTHLDTGEVREFERVSDACKELGLSTSHIHRVLVGKNNHHHRWHGHYLNPALQQFK